MIYHTLLSFVALVSLAFSTAGTGKKEMYGHYQYVYPNQDTLLVYKRHVLTLSFDKNFVFYEDHENFQCFANLADYGGRYTLRHDTLFCQRTGIVMNNYDVEKRYILPIDVFKQDYDTVLRFRITFDTLYSIDQPGIQLARQH